MSDDNEQTPTADIVETQTTDAVEKVGLPRPYEYFDTPNGEDIREKLWCVLKPTASVALAVSTVDVAMYSKPKSYPAAFRRYAWVSLPIFGISIAFVLSSNLAKIYRDKEDYWNWAIGGFGAGAVLAVYKGNMAYGWGYGSAFAIAAVGKKWAVDNGITLIPQGNQALGTIRFVRHDYSLTSYRPGNYTVGPVGSGATEALEEHPEACEKHTEK